MEDLTPFLRRMVDGVVHKFQIKNNAIDSLGIILKTPPAGTTSPLCPGPPSGTCWGLAEFRSKANLKNLTTGEGLGGSLTLQVTMIDKGEPGRNDTFAVTLWSGSTLLFSSNWNGAKTVEQQVGGGNLVVH